MKNIINKINATYKIKIIFFLIGLWILTLGIALVVHSSFGVGPWDLVNLGLVYHVGLTYGTWVNVISIIQLSICGILIKKIPRISTLITSLIMGISIDLWLLLLNYIPNSNYLYKILIFMPGLILISIGASLYLVSGLPPSSFDYFMVTIRDSFKFSLRKSKVLVESLGLCLGLLLGQTSSIGLGTVFMVLAAGPMIQFFLKYSTSFFDKLISKYNNYNL